MGKAEVLLRLHGSRAHNEQIDAWRADVKAFEEIKTNQKAELRRVRGEAYQVASLYAMFQGVIFTAVSQPNRLSCALSWCPAFLSLAVSVAALLAIADKLYNMGEVTEDIIETCGNISAVFHCLDMVEELGTDVDLQITQPRNECQRDRLAGYRYIVSKDGIFALLFLIGFSSLVISFSVRILCHNCPRCIS